MLPSDISIARPGEVMAARSWRARVQLQLPFVKPARPGQSPSPPSPRKDRIGGAPVASAPVATDPATDVPAAIEPAADVPAGPALDGAAAGAAGSPAPARRAAEVLEEDEPADEEFAEAPPLLSAEALVLEVQVNRRLRRTYRWRIVGDRLIVERPERVSERDLQSMLATIRERAAAYLRRQTVGSDAALLARARRLLGRYFPERPTLRAVGWSARQHKRHGSCSGGTGVIRLAAHLQRYPPWVVDYVLVHELAHLLHHDHSPGFWAVVGRYPLAERARGFLLACDLGFAADERAEWPPQPANSGE
jgi:predicted metal-dependent hydrolase